MIKMTSSNYKKIIDKMRIDKQWAKDNIFLFHNTFLSYSSVEHYAYDHNILLSIDQYEHNDSYYIVKYADDLIDY